MALKMFSNFSDEMWCNTDKVLWKTEMKRPTQRVISKHREQDSEGGKDKNKETGSAVLEGKGLK